MDKIRILSVAHTEIKNPTKNIVANVFLVGSNMGLLIL